MRFTYEQIRELTEQIENETDIRRVIDLVRRLDEALDWREMLMRSSLDAMRRTGPPAETANRVDLGR